MQSDCGCKAITILYIGTTRRVAGPGKSESDHLKLQASRSVAHHPTHKLRPYGGYQPTGIAMHILQLSTGGTGTGQAPIAHQSPGTGPLRLSATSLFRTTVTRPITRSLAKPYARYQQSLLFLAHIIPIPSVSLIFLLIYFEIEFSTLLPQPVIVTRITKKMFPSLALAVLLAYSVLVA